MGSRKRVAVIGAGPSGMGAMKELMAEGLEPVCFERTGHYGGLWRYHDDDTEGIASVMKTTIINTSKELGAISDCPPPSEFPNYMHHTMMYEYLSMLVKKNGGLEHMNFYQQVISVAPTEDYQETGRWVVTTKDTRNGAISSGTFDGVMVCVGHHVFPHMPSFPGMEDFQGKIMHTHSLKKVSGFEDQRVVVVGVGNSGMDAAVEISSVAKQVYLSSRRGTWVLPRVGPYGHPFDAAAIRRWTHYLQKLLPYSFVCSVFEKNLNKRFNHATYHLKPEHRALSQHPTVSDTLPIKLLSGTVVVRGGIKEFTKTGVIFEGEKDVTECDSVVLGTGYQIKFPFLRDDILPVKENKVRLYKNIYPPHHPHPTLAILGLIQPNGPGFPPGEMQCRWSAMVMSGKCKLPSQEEMMKDILKKEETRQKRFVDSPRHTVQVDFIDYQDELAEIIGVKPNFLKMAFTDPKLFWVCMTGPSLPYQYRLSGPHSWEGARKAILTYKDRVKTPLKKPGEPLPTSGKQIGNWALRMMFLLPVVLWFLLSIFTRT